MALRMANTLGWLWMECGDLTRGEELNARAADGARKRGDPETIANPELNLADIFITKGDLALAGKLLEGVRALVGAPSTSEWMRWRYSTHLLASLADLVIAQGDHAAAEARATEGVELARFAQSRKYLVRGLRPGTDRAGRAEVGRRGASAGRGHHGRALDSESDPAVANAR